MREETKTLTFAAIICVSCSLLLSGTAAGLKKRQEENVKFDIKRNIVKAFGVDIKDATHESVAKDFKDHITAIVVDPKTGDVIKGMKPDDISSDELEAKTKLPLYIWKDNGKITKYAFPISGHGLWSMLYGYLALNNDLQTIAGITFYKDGETPGLGAEIEKEWFQSQFSGKKAYKKDGSPTKFKVTKPNMAKGPTEVDGISGATLTGNGVQALLRHDMGLYAPYFNKIRGK